VNEDTSAAGESSELMLAHLLTHEARTLLNAIGGFAELLVAGACRGLCGEAHAMAAEIARAARDLEVVLDAATALLGASARGVRVGELVSLIGLRGNDAPFSARASF
jgi:signal transduction histidine kinase